MAGRELIVNFAPTGMVPTKAMTPYVPIDPEEIAEQVQQAYEIGITLAHLHARDEASGAPTYKKEVYSRILEKIRRFCPELVICFSLSGRNFNTFEFRSEAIELRPDMGSLTLSSLNFPNQSSVNDPEMIRKLALKMKEYGVHPELEVFDLGMLQYAKYLIEKQILEAPYYVNIIAGNIAGLQATPAHLGQAIQDLPPGAWWALGGIGRQQLDANTIAIASGGGVRVGLEDNIYYDLQRRILATNADLLKRVHNIANMFERPVMSPKTFGDMGFYNKKL
jgi:3-keto-5-aminohexanoate cleavage enzyme